MKHLLFIFLLWPIVLFGQFSTHDPGFPEMYEIADVNAIDYDVIWAIARDQSGGGNSPWFSISTDGGTTWNANPIGVSDDLEPAMVFAFDENTAYIPLYKTNALGAFQQGIYYTNDGGITWARQNGAFENPDSWPDIVHFWDVNTGVSIGDQIDGEMEIFTTTDGGANWNQVPAENIPDALEGENALNGTYAVYGDIVWFTSTKGRIFKSTDKGYTWAAYNTPFNSFCRIAFKDENTGWITDVGQWEFAQLASTSDGGETWQYVSYTGPLLNWDLNYVPGTQSTVVTSGAYLNNGIAYSNNGGLNWYWIDEPGTKYFKMDWIDASHGWAGGINDELHQALMYKYVGLGLEDYLIRPTELNFGEVMVEQNFWQQIVIQNLGVDIIEITSIYTTNVVFAADITSAVVEPFGGGLVFNVGFAPNASGSFIGALVLESTHPSFPYIEIPLYGSGYSVPFDLQVDPSQINLNLFTGESGLSTLTLSNNGGTNVNYQANIQYTDPVDDLSALGWHYGSSPFDGNSGVLGDAPDQAQFIKDFEIPEFTYALLNLGYDDGCRVWINGILAFDFHEESHGMNYWDQQLDVSAFIHSGKNRIAVEVYNGVYNGGGTGAFDCELLVDGAEIIKRGDQYPGTPEAMWYFYGETYQVLTPPPDHSNLTWNDINYGKMDWLKLSKENASLTSLGWVRGYSPFGGFDAPILASSPDQAQFIKEFTIGEFSQATLFLGIDDGCVVYINGNLYFDFTYGDQGLFYWNYELDVTPYLVPGLNNIAVEVYNGMYAGALAGGFDCQLTIDGVDVIKRGDLNPGAPETLWYYYGQAGQMLAPPLDNSDKIWFETDYGKNSNDVQEYGWKFLSTPINESSGILGATPDKAQFYKDVYLDPFGQAYLNLAFDDGCKIWINGNLHYDFHTEVHNINYWDQQIDLTNILHPGNNRIAVEVYNGIFGGGGAGGFDCELIADGVEIIKRGDIYYGEPECMWYCFGETGQMLNPPNDMNNNEWISVNYFKYGVLSNTVSGVIFGYLNDNFDVIMNTQDLLPGTYNANINIIDQVKGQVTVPVVMNIAGAPDILLSTRVLNFETVYLGYSKELTCTLKNTGTELLQLTDVQVSVDFYAGFTDYIISDGELDPGEEAVITVICTPEYWMQYGYQEATLFLYSNDPDEMVTDIQCTVTILEAPDLVIENLEYLYASLCPGESQNFIVQMNNFGASDLVWDLPQFGGKASKAAVLNDVVFFEDHAEEGENNWTFENYYESPLLWHQTTRDYFSEMHSWWCGIESQGNYNNNQAVRQAIVTPFIHLPDVELPFTLEFYENYEIEGGYDQGSVDVTVDDGQTWINIRGFIECCSGGWVMTSLDLSWLRGQTFKIRFFFDTGDAVANEFPGWFIDDIRVYAPGFTWLDATPISGTIQPGNAEYLNVSFNTSGMAEGYYSGLIAIRSNDPQTPLYYIPCFMNIVANAVSHQIDIPAGWSGISSYVFPENNNIETMFADVLDRLVIMQDMQQTFWPEQWIYDLNSWNYHQGYKIKMNSEATVFINGNLPGNMFVNLQSGWNILPTLYYSPLDVHILDNVLSARIAKEVAGPGVYWPEFEINTIGEFQPGKSYYVNVNDNELMAFPTMLKKSGMVKSVISYVEQISPWNIIHRSASSHIVGINGSALNNFKPGDVIGIFNDAGICAGSISISDNSSNQCIVVFGDDIFTSEKEGLSDGEPFILKLFKAETKETIVLEAGFDSEMPDQQLFTTEGLSAVLWLKTIENLGNNPSTPVTIYPNPVRDLVQISGLQDKCDVEVYNQQGLKMISFTSDNQQGILKLDVSKYQPGVYELRINDKTGKVVRKFVKM